MFADDAIPSNLFFKVVVKLLSVWEGKLVKLEPSPTNAFAVIVPLELILPEEVTLEPFTIRPSLPKVPIFTVSFEFTSKIGIPEISLTVNSVPSKESVIENSCPWLPWTSNIVLSPVEPDPCTMSLFLP